MPHSPAPTGAVGPPAASSPSTPGDVLSLAVRSGVLAPDHLQRFLARHEPAALPDRDTAARLLVSGGFLSKFRAELLLLGSPNGLTLGRYRLTELLGKGGMGRVFLAHDPQLDRDVAVKVLQDDPTRPDLRARFLRETRASAAVRHPNVVGAHDSGEQDGLLYLVMEYVRGVNLHAHVTAVGRLPAPAAAGYICQAARGLAAVHAAGLVHRDIKPGNLILTDDGTVKLFDLGLARFVEPRRPEDGPLTQTHNPGEALGTPQFMAPEQCARGDSVDPRSDVFGLGAVLYFLLTARFPRAGFPTAQAALPELVPVARVQPDLPPALCELIGRMLSAPSLRPQTAEDVAAALAPFANGADDQDRKSLPGRAALLAAAAVLVAVAVWVGIASALWPASAPEPTAEPPAQSVAFLPAAEVAPPPHAPPVVRDGGVIARFEKGLGGVALSPSGALLAATEHSGRVVLRDLVTGEVQSLPGGSGSHSRLAFDATGRRLAYVSQPHRVTVWDVPARRVTTDVDYPERVLAVALHPGGRQVLAGDLKGTAHWHNLDTGSERKFASVPQAPLVSVGFRPGSDQVLRCAQHTSMLTLLEPAGSRMSSFPVPGTPTQGGLCLAPDGKRAVVVTFQRLAVLDLERKDFERAIPGPERSLPFSCAAIGPRGKWVVSGGPDGWVRVWDLATGAELGAAELWAEGKRLITGVAVAADGRTCVACGVDGVVRSVRLALPE